MQRKPALMMAAMFGLACLFSAPATMAANASKEVKTAAKHAQLSAASSEVKNVHMHMHHVLNCLVGSDGEGFDESYANPCQSMGNGAMNDNDDMAASLGRTADLLRIGLEVDQLESAQNVAKAAHSMLANDADM